MKFTEEELRRAAVRVQEKQLAALPAPETCTDTFSPAYAQKLQQLSEELKRGQLAQAVAPMGWQYYTRRSIAAILLCFLLACATMPEAVLAGYQKMLETVQEICELYTQLRYNSHVTGNAKFVPLQPTYLPDGLEEVRREEGENEIDLLYIDRKTGRYFKMYQCFLTEKDSVTHIVDTEKTDMEIAYLGAEKVETFFKKNEIYFIWSHNTYEVTGKANLSREEVLQILKYMV